MSRFKLPPNVSFTKERISGQWTYIFQHSELGTLGRIVLQARSDGNTQINCELAGDPNDPMTEKRAAIFKPLSLTIMDQMESATGGPPPENVVLDEIISPPSPPQRIATKHIQCEVCGEHVAFLVFADTAKTIGEIENYARMMYGVVSRLNVPTWVIGGPLGFGDPSQQSAHTLQIWPERQPSQKLRPDEFNPILDELMATHCG